MCDVAYLLLAERLDRLCLALTIGVVVGHAVSGDESGKQPELPDPEQMREQFNAALRQGARPVTPEEQERAELLNALGVKNRRR